MGSPSALPVSRSSLNRNAPSSLNVGMYINRYPVEGTAIEG